MSIYLIAHIFATWVLFLQPEIRSVERGIGPIATLYSLAAAYKRGAG